MATLTVFSNFNKKQIVIALYIEFDFVTYKFWLLLIFFFFFLSKKHFEFKTLIRGGGKEADLSDCLK